VGGSDGEDRGASGSGSGSSAYADAALLLAPPFFMAAKRCFLFIFLGADAAGAGAGVEGLELSTLGATVGGLGLSADGGIGRGGDAFFGGTGWKTCCCLPSGLSKDALAFA